MTTDRLRRHFLDYFKKNGHTVVASDSLIPQHDPTLLFTGAGMNQFKDQFMGRNISFKRAVSSQKCLRTADLENVGVTSGHHTFFEMLGNFSFGDYFKREAITWAWEFLTKELRISKEELWVSVYTEDDEAYKIWQDEIGVPEERIVKLGDKENFWPSEVKKHGPNGPCGPCSEIFYDWGKSTGCGKESCSPSCDCGRFVEIWNLVFTQFERKEKGVLVPLPSKNIDTGMGLERLASVMQKRDTNFKIDIFLPLTKAISKEANVPYGRSKDSDSHMNAIADHIRAASFAIYDGARPSNEGRGFVIRKLIRKASQRARALGMYEPFLYKIVPIVAKMMKAQYPELTKAREDIAGVVLREEENLKEVLDTLLPRVEEDLASLKDSNKNIVPGALIFKYYDEKGLPFDLIEEKAKECSLALDRDGFDKLLEAQKTRSRGKSKVAGSIFFEKLSDVNLKTEFVCDQTSIKTKVLALIKDKEKIHVALDKTVFYGESGGQAGDRGEIVGPDLMIEIEAAKKYEDTIDHVGRIIKGKLNINDEVEARIDSTRRNNIKKNHTATHLLHSALKKVLGNHVRQYGSLVEADRLRFDFTHGSRLEERQIQEIEELVNANIQEDIRISTDTMSLEQAKGAGAIALFGEKYKGMVMVRTIGNISKELCGGTHVSHTGDIGAFKILNESSIASGVRRIEAVTSYAVYNWLKNDIRKTVKEVKVSLEGIKELSKGTDEPIEIIKRIEEYLSPALFKASSIENKSNEDFTKKDVDLWTGELKQEFARTIADISKEAKKIKKDKESKALIELKKEMDNFIKDAKSVNGVKVISREVSGADSGILRSLVDSLKNSAGSCIAMLGARHASRADMVCGVTKDLVAKGIDASKIIKKAAPFIEGSGGGRPDLAQAGGKSPEKLTEALEAVFKIVKEERGS